MSSERNDQPPMRHKARRLWWGTPRLIAAIERAGREVKRSVKGSPELGVGNIGRPRGGSLAPYSQSHQAGRDCDLTFYRHDENGPAAAVDPEHFDGGLTSPQAYQPLQRSAASAVRRSASR